MQNAVAAHHTPSDDAEINLTPMLDVVFIMLIFFIVTATFVKESGIEVARPAAPPEAVPADSNILVAISGNDEIWIDRRMIDWRAVRANIERLSAESPEARVIVLADSSSSTEVLVRVMNASREAGVYDISLAE